MFAKSVLFRTFAASAQASNRVAFIGLGNMGLPMTLNLQKAGFQVTGYEVDAERRTLAKNAGVTVADSIKSAVSDADWVVCSLPKTEHVEEVLKGPGGLFETAKRHSYILDTSTISPVASASFNEEAAKHDLVFLDAPVSGGTPGAIAGTLTFMVGGEKAQFEHAMPVLQGMGSNFFHCGKPGSGEIAKLVNNLTFAIEMIGASEGIAMGEKLGIDPKVLTDIVSVSTGRCFSITGYNPRPGIQENARSSHNYEGGFQTNLVKKDLSLAIEAANHVGALSEFSQKAIDYYSDMERKGAGNKDFSYVFQYIYNNKTISKP